jgi:hypothetical protein
LGCHVEVEPLQKVLALALQRAANHPSGPKAWKDPQSFFTKLSGG